MERKGVEPSTTALRTQQHSLASECRKRVAEGESDAWTRAWQNGAEIEHGDAVGESVSSNAAEPVLSKPGTLPIKVDSFSAALMLIASLPLSDAEKADAVRRLMAEQAAG